MDGTYPSGLAAETTGDANTFLQTLFTNKRASPFGTSYKSMHEIGFNKRLLSPQNQPPGDGHPTRMEFKVSSTLGHLLHNMYFRVRFCIKPKTAAQLATVLNGKFDEVDGDPRTLTKLLENPKLHQDGLLGCIDNVEMRHNSIVFQRLRRDNMRLLRKEQYNKEDHELQSRLVNGGPPKYHYLVARNSSGTEAPIAGADSTFALDNFLMRKENLDERDGYQNQMVTNGSNKGHGGMWDTTSGLSDMQRRTRNQWESLRIKCPDDSKYEILEDYKPEFCHEIGLKDLPSEVLCCDSTAGNKVAAALDKIRTQGGWVFDQWFEVPHPWHYNTADAFPILNLVNDMDVIFHLRPWQQWIQNWDMVQNLVDIEMSDIDMLINYYDIPKAIWDDQFPLNRQMNHYAPDYQEHLEEFTIEVPVPSASEIDNAEYTSYKSTGVQKDINVNTVDRVARYGMLRLQGAEAVRNSTFAYDFYSWDLLKSAWLEVANEKLLTKIETDVDKNKKYIERSQHFKELKNFVPGDVYYFPLGLDCDVHNPGGGVVNIRPFYNNFKLRMNFDPVKVHQLYIGQALASAGAAGSTLTTGTSAATSLVTQYANSQQHYKGFITKTANNTYQMKLRASINFLVLDLVTYQQGQLYKQA